MDETRRFLLGSRGANPLFVMGLNPSVADKERSDHTITRIKHYASRHPWEGFVMLNIYAQRTPQPANLHHNLDTSLHQHNISHIKKILEKHPGTSIVAAWGGTITIRPYLSSCLTDILQHIRHIPLTWLQIGDCLTAKFHPRHPSRGAYQTFQPFDIRKYLHYHFS
jgi:hypothetical protein